MNRIMAIAYLIGLVLTAIILLIAIRIAQGN